MALAMGAAKVPPWYSFCEGWFGSTTATAMVGVAAGANAANQASICPVPVWAVPVLPATATPGMRAATPVPLGLLTTDNMSCVAWVAVAAVVACTHGFDW